MIYKNKNIISFTWYATLRAIASKSEILYYLHVILSVKYRELYLVSHAVRPVYGGNNSVSCFTNLNRLIVQITLILFFSLASKII